MECVLAEAAENGRKATVTAAERALSIPHATFDRNYRHLIDDFRHQACNRSLPCEPCQIARQGP